MKFSEQNNLTSIALNSVDDYENFMDELRNVITNDSINNFNNLLCDKKANLDFVKKLDASEIWTLIMTEGTTQKMGTIIHQLTQIEPNNQPNNHVNNIKIKINSQINVFFLHLLLSVKRIVDKIQKIIDLIDNQKNAPLSKNAKFFLANLNRLFNNLIEKIYIFLSTQEKFLEAYFLSININREESSPKIASSITLGFEQSDKDDLSNEPCNSTNFHTNSTQL